MHLAGRLPSAYVQSEFAVRQVLAVALTKNTAMRHLGLASNLLSYASAKAGLHVARMGSSEARSFLSRPWQPCW